jgi:hypothetical protein
LRLLIEISKGDAGFPVCATVVGPGGPGAERAAGAAIDGREGRCEPAATCTEAFLSLPPSLPLSDPPSLATQLSLTCDAALRVLLRACTCDSICHARNHARAELHCVIHPSLLPRCHSLAVHRTHTAHCIIRTAGLPSLLFSLDPVHVCAPSFAGYG